MHVFNGVWNSLEKRKNGEKQTKVKVTKNKEQIGTTKRKVCGNKEHRPLMNGKYNIIIENIIMENRHYLVLPKLPPRPNQPEKNSPCYRKDKI